MLTLSGYFLNVMYYCSYYCFLLPTGAITISTTAATATATARHPFMLGKCCKTCGNCTAACLGPPAPAVGRVTPWVRALGMIGASTADSGLGMRRSKSDSPSDVKAPAAKTVVLLWLQNSNNTWALQVCLTSLFNLILS